jgi:plasmid stabilization system protein ParE
VIRIKITSDALEDLNEGYLFYEAQEDGLVEYFSDSLKSDIEGLKVTGGVHRLAFRDYRRALSRIFPYAIYYSMEGQTVTIWAVIDCRRNPEWISDHLG